MERDEDTFAESGKTVYRDCINWSNNDHCAKTKANYCCPDCGDYRQLVKLVKRPETLEEIEVDLRSDKRRFSNSTGVVIAQRIEAARKRMEWTHKKELETRDAVIQTEVAAREAEREAHKRELEAVGNAAKLREALKLCLRGMCGYCRMDAEARGMTTECVNGCAVMHDAKAALAAPARNCDKYDAESCRIAYHLHGDGLMTMQAFADWLFAPATESEAGK